MYFIPDETCGMCYKDSPSTQMFQCAYSSFSEIPLSVQGTFCQEEEFDISLDGRSGGACLHPVFLELTEGLLLLCLLTKGILSSFENLQNLLDLCRTKVTEGLCRAKILLTLLPFSPQPVVQCTESSPCVH